MRIMDIKIRYFLHFFLIISFTLFALIIIQNFLEIVKSKTLLINISLNDLVGILLLECIIAIFSFIFSYGFMPVYLTPSTIEIPYKQNNNDSVILKTVEGIIADINKPLIPKRKNIIHKDGYLFFITDSKYFNWLLPSVSIMIKNQSILVTGPHQLIDTLKNNKKLSTVLNTP